jgi:formylglycine-generating enzyme required for sulfatase activity
VYEKYPYPNDRKGHTQRENLEASQDEPRVLRGGGFFRVQWNVRCAFRLWDRPVVGLNYWGFRVVVLPKL